MVKIVNYYELHFKGGTTGTLKAESYDIVENYKEGMHLISFLDKNDNNILALCSGTVPKVELETEKETVRFYSVYVD